MDLETFIFLMTLSVTVSIAVIGFAVIQKLEDIENKLNNKNK